ncbi:bacterial transcriptional activator domain-containing protein [Polaribacter ponticola]|uniref:Bacterial transcriptional activator domain-containing protein n=1 Tax=Polaribacter ponticola TaxID=2978475 RepID=A0ABT5S5I4_9FLAO|nr:bacterial transcriptional activator domain-containing protein [Polaribacter sp. MSW5]MDD7913357.1 bacterial transcriptional activator domain-containing protein [Polaribacter sp. MSW5]
MLEFHQQLQKLKTFQENAKIRIETLGNFCVWRNEHKIDTKEWGRDKTIQLLQYLISNRQRNALHKEKIMDGLWEDWNDRDFKVALHGINKNLEPNRPSRTEAIYILRQGVSYQIDLDKVWIDVEALEKYIIIGNETFSIDKSISKEAYKKALKLYKGSYLPNRIYEDWTSEEREKIQLLILSAYITLAEILINENPLESIRLAQQALAIDATWEDAYRIQMQAYIVKGNRPQAIKTYMKCEVILEEEYGITPLPETKELLKKIEEIN